MPFFYGGDGDGGGSGGGGDGEEREVVNIRRLFEQKKEFLFLEKKLKRKRDEGNFEVK